MEMTLEQRSPPDSSAVLSTSNELVKRIRKLRWIGMEEEAERLRNELARQRATASSLAPVDD